MQKVSNSRIDDFLKAICAGRKVFAHERDGNQYHMVKSGAWIPGTHTLAPYRAVEPLKSLVFKPRESLGSLSGNGAVPAADDSIVLGVKNCDLSALKIHDYVFLKCDPPDPFYAEARGKTILVSCDCTDARDVCFCPAVYQQPYPTEGFDINLSEVSSGYVVEAGSDAGEKVLKNAAGLLEPADGAVIEDRNKRRQLMMQKVSEQSGLAGMPCKADFQKAIRKSEESGLWGSFAENCVECGACNLCCCTCHCFLLADGVGSDKSVSRTKLWDACLYRNFARVAGGANPRKHRAERLYNRFDKKFNFFPGVLGSYACDGCGRCIEACAGKIDIRKVLRKAVDEL